MPPQNLIDRVIADTEHHVQHSADPEVHRHPDHVIAVLIPHLERIKRLITGKKSAEFESRIKELESTNPPAAQSLTLLIIEIRENGLEACLRKCLGL